MTLHRFSTPRNRRVLDGQPAACYGSGTLHARSYAMLETLPIWARAGLWGLAGAASLVVGATVAWGVKLGTRWTAAIMSFGCGILISAVAYDLIFEGFRHAGIRPI